MSENLIIALLNFAVKFGVDAAIAIIKSLKSSATIDDAIAALEVAKTKTAQQYLDEEKTVSVTTAPVVEPPPTPEPPANT